VYLPTRLNVIALSLLASAREWKHRVPPAITKTIKAMMILICISFVIPRVFVTARGGRNIGGDHYETINYG
jgi:hypothetical protein